MRRQKRLGRNDRREERTCPGRGMETRCAPERIGSGVFLSPAILRIGRIFYFWSHSVISRIKPNTLYIGTERLHTIILSNQTLPKGAKRFTLAMICRQPSPASFAVLIPVRACVRARAHACGLTTCEAPSCDAMRCELATSAAFYPLLGSSST